MILTNQLIFCQDFQYSDTLKLDKDGKYSSNKIHLTLKENKFIFTFNYLVGSGKLVITTGVIEENDKSINLKSNLCLSSNIDYSFNEEIDETSKIYLYSGFSANLIFLDSNVCFINYGFNPETYKDCSKKIVKKMSEIFENSFVEDKPNDRYIISEKKYDSLFLPSSGVYESLELISDNSYALTIIYSGSELILTLDKKPNNFVVGNVINENNNLISDVRVNAGVLIMHRLGLK